MLRIKTQQKGFTLIELAIVIAIIGILVAIAVPQFVDLQSEARTAQEEATLNSVRSAIAMYIAENKVAPTTSDLQSELTVQGGTINIDGSNNLEFDTGNRTFIVETYSDSDCSTNASSGDQVNCVQLPSS